MWLSWKSHFLSTIAILIWCILGTIAPSSATSCDAAKNELKDIFTKLKPKIIEIQQGKSINKKDLDKLAFQAKNVQVEYLTGCTTELEIKDGKISNDKLDKEFFFNLGIIKWHQNLQDHKKPRRERRGKDYAVYLYAGSEGEPNLQKMRSLELYLVPMEHVALNEKIKSLIPDAQRIKIVEEKERIKKELKGFQKSSPYKVRPKQKQTARSSSTPSTDRHHLSLETLKRLKAARSKSHHGVSGTLAPRPSIQAPFSGPETPRAFGMASAKKAEDEDENVDVKEKEGEKKDWKFFLVWWFIGGGASLVIIGLAAFFAYKRMRSSE